MMIPKWMYRIDDWLDRVAQVLAASLYLLLVSFIAINIIARNLWHMASHRLLELAPAVVLWLALVGAILALKRQRHIKIELALRFFPSSFQKTAQAITALFSMGVCGVLAYAAIPFLLNEVMLFGAWGWLGICLPLFFGVAFIGFAFNLMACFGWMEEKP